MSELRILRTFKLLHFKFSEHAIGEVSPYRRNSIRFVFGVRKEIILV